ncbi:hypothetical protein FQA39_LY01110 [Lamprigera yunnana]|nr:hypothetical protein FQA39_LY01110 [Lamprigera yunnana]
MDLWKKFHRHGTEMIVTKTGRRMFPFLRVKLSGLDPTAYYFILLDFSRVTNNRFRYYTNVGWTPAGCEGSQRNQKVYVHPESPASGEHWMSQPVTFGRVKLSNSVEPASDLILLSSMHKYQPRIVIVKSFDPCELAWAPTTTVFFPETQFVTVTAYQNEEITKLKIENNPFAKGFRKTTQEKCKRKRDEAEESNDSVSTSSPSPENENAARPLELSSMLYPTCYPNYNALPFMPFDYLSYVYYLSKYYPYAPYTNPQSSTREETSPKREVPKRLTDFSIRAITGL